MDKAAWRIRLGFMVGLAFLLAGFLIGPRVQPQEQKAGCVGNIHLPGPFGIELNCDSPEFMWLAREPSALLTKNRRQSRPGLIIAAAMLQMPLSQVVPFNAPPRMIGPTNDTAAIVNSFDNNLPTYLAYVLLNISILIVSFVILQTMMEQHENDGRAKGAANALIIVSTGFLLVANDVTKAFVWSPHTQMFNILVPVLAFYVTLRLLRGGLLDRFFVLSIGLTVGFGLTAYPVFVVIAACAIPIAIWTIITERKHRGRAAAHLASLLVLSIIPSLVWYVYVRATTGSFFVFEIAQDGDVVWMAEDWAEGIGHFVAEWLKSLWEVLSLAAPQAIPLVALIALLVIFALHYRAALRHADQVWLIMAAGVYVSGALLGFYTCIGDGEARLAYSSIPPLIAASGAVALVLNQQLPAIEQRKLPTGFLIIALVQMLVVVVKDGPFS